MGRLRVWIQDVQLLCLGIHADDQHKVVSIACTPAKGRATQRDDHWPTVGQGQPDGSQWIGAPAIRRKE